VSGEVHHRSGKRKYKVAMPQMTYVLPVMLVLRMIFVVFYHTRHLRTVFNGDGIGYGG
jgi:hypothetical protein